MARSSAREKFHLKITRLASRWRIPEEDLSNQIQAEGWRDNWSTTLSEQRLDAIAERLDELFPESMQWNFWFRPSIAHDVAPACRVGWESPGGDLETILEELQTLVTEAARLGDTRSDSKVVLRLLKPVVMRKFIDWTNGHLVTESRVEARPQTFRPLRFSTEQTAPYVAQCPFDNSLQ